MKVKGRGQAQSHDCLSNWKLSMLQQTQNGGQTFFFHK